MQGALKWTRATIFCALVVAVGALVGCGGGDVVAQDPRGNAYAAEFAQAREETDDPALLEMLADGWITDAEMSTALDMTVQCLQDKGLNANAEPEYAIQFYDEDGAFTDDEVEAKRVECMGKFYDPINVLYAIPRENPNNEDMARLLYECFLRVGIVPSGTTYDQYFADPPAPPGPEKSLDWEGCFEDRWNYGK